MRSNRLVLVVAFAALTILSTNAPALEPLINLTRAIQPEGGPAAPGDHSGVATFSDACPATSVGVLTHGDTIVGSTIGSTDDFTAHCGSNPGGRDEIFEFAVDVPGVWGFDTCTVPACWDTVLEIRQETGGGCPGDFLDCDGDDCSVCYYESALPAYLIPSNAYYLIVDGWSTYAYGDFTITVTLAVAGCASDADCDDGSFCNGAETCDTATGRCSFRAPHPCTTYEGFTAPCDEDLDSCSTPDDCFTWIAGAASGYFVPQANLCPDTATWVFDDVQGSHHTTGVLDFYTTPIIARSTTPSDPGPHLPFLVDQALFTVESGTCNPYSQIAGSQCTGTATVDPAGSPAHDLPCSGTMPLLPNNTGDFNRCEIDFFMAYRTTENGAGLSIAEQRPLLGGPAGLDEFGTSVFWLEDCPPTGDYYPAWSEDDSGSYFFDFATAVVCQKPGGSCCLPDGSCSLTSEADCASFGGAFGFTGTINGTDGGCGGDPDGDGVDNPCDNCPDDANAGQEDCDGDGEGDVCEMDPCEQDDDGDGVCNCVDNCPTVSNPNQSDRDGDGVGDACDGCPDDPKKVEPGICGCEVPDDVDSDGDGAVDCIDLCPGVDDAVFAPQCVGAIPTTSQWGLVVLTLLLLAGGKIYFRGRGAVPTSPAD